MILTIKIDGILFNIDRHGFVTCGGAGYHIKDAIIRFHLLAMNELRKLAISTKVTEIRQQTYRIMKMIPIKVVE